MQKVGVAKLGPSTQSDLSDLKDLIAQAEKEMPGVVELLQVYGEYDKAIQQMHEYLEVTNPEALTTTSNESHTLSGGL